MRNFFVFSLIAVVVLVHLYVGFLYFRPDETLNPQAVVWLENDSSVIPKEQNSHYLIWGINAPAETSMFEYGEAMVAHIIKAQREAAGGDNGGEVGDVPPGFENRRLIEAVGLSALCEPSEKYCLDEYRDNLHKLLAQGDNRLLLERYRTLIGVAHYQAVESLYTDTPMPRFLPLLNAQRLHLAMIAMRYMEGERRQALAQLATDLRFSRMLIAQADSLIVRLIAVKMTASGLQLYGQLLDLPEADDVVAEVKAITVLTRDERDFNRVIAGEFRFMANTLAEIESGDEAAESWGFPVDTVFPFRKHRMLNLQYDYMSGVVALSRLAPAQFDVRAVGFEGEHAFIPDTWDYVFDPVTVILNEVAAPSLVAYLRREYELDGLVRLLKLKAAITQASVPKDEFTAYISSSPYASADIAGKVPIRWDPQSCRLYAMTAEGEGKDALYQLPFKRD